MDSAAVEEERSNLAFLPKAGLPEAMLNRIIRIAAFQNPEFYKTQAMRLSTWDKPRIISCAEEFAQHVALPRGCLQHRVHDGKKVVRVYDYVDAKVPMLARMYEKRLRGYRAIGYELEAEPENDSDLQRTAE